MTGKTIQDVKDSKMTKADLAEAIAEIQVNSDRNTKMEDYLDKLTELANADKVAADDLAALLSDDGRSMSATFISSAINSNGTFNKEAVEKLLSKAGLTAE
jgi:hypothetical protein